MHVKTGQRSEPGCRRLLPLTLTTDPGPTLSLRHKMLIHRHLTNLPAIALVNPHDDLHAAERLVVRRRSLPLADVVGAVDRAARY